MIKKNEKGFTLVMSLVLLLAMSLMGGGLIVISSSDHQSNNSSDDFQQTFYVAEHALLEAQKSLINSMMGKVKDDGTRDEDKRHIPTNVEQAISKLDDGTPCYKSFRNISRKDFKVVEHIQDVSFYDIISPILDETSNFGSSKQVTGEINRMKKFKYEYFSVNAGSADYKSVGGSLKKTSSSVQRQGTAYRIYACGIMGSASKPEILVPLETIAILSH